ncbi:hypothetical protein [Cupriavidus consociatus]|uniref:hypothetical protein n=1 Tax=Cupriavidus consociatus TaxID=2821357 RepID=UPI001AEAECCB|nr:MULTISPECIES: hypothetical protein [unclassified Cupriavidus]MBP0620471.1 hypothetical protein [Cupriavidus sp. LEh25]MDK2657129.1 hypothetical protein [Cupriavidus sp. LEh21]
MAQCGSRACWFGLGVALGAALGATCAMLLRASPARGRPDPRADAPVVPSNASADRALTDDATDVVEYRGFVVHVFCHALGPGRFKALCDIWESGAVVLEGGGPPTTHARPEDARAAAISWARQWVQRNG